MVVGSISKNDSCQNIELCLVECQLGAKLKKKHFLIKHNLYSANSSSCDYC
jgi:hypothetical protein